MKQNLRIWVVGSVLVGGALLGGGWLLGIQPLLATAADNDAATATADTQNQQLQTRLAVLRTEEANIGTLRAEAAKAANAVPASLDAQSFVNRVNVLAASDGVTVEAISPTAPQAYTQPDPSFGKVEAFVDPRITGANFVYIPISVQVNGTAKQDRTFLGHLQKDSRLFLVDGYTFAQATSGDGMSATISGYIYALKS